MHSRSGFLQNVSQKSRRHKSSPRVFCVCCARPSMETWWIIIIKTLVCALPLIIVASHIYARRGEQKWIFSARARLRNADTRVRLVEIIICAHMTNCWLLPGRLLRSFRFSHLCSRHLIGAHRAKNSKTNRIYVWTAAARKKQQIAHWAIRPSLASTFSQFYSHAMNINGRIFNWDFAFCSDSDIFNY